MAKAALNTVIRRLLSARSRGSPPDRHLLERFIAHQDEAAFAALVERHGAMVLAVARNVLRHREDAEDVFQATFLVLARKAGSVRKLGSAGSWLHGVAYRLALKARTAAAARHRLERRAPARTPEESPDDLTWRELREILHEELERLPDKYRSPLVLCYLEGLTQDQAAEHLGLAKGTLRGRLERARLLLRGRLSRRGLAPAVLLLADTSRPTVAALPSSLVSTMARSGVAFAAGQEAGVSVQVAQITEGVLRAMCIKRITIAAVVVVAIVIAGGTQLVVRTAARTATAQEQKQGDDTSPPVSDKGRPPIGDQDNEAAAKAARPAISNPADPTVAAELAKFEGTWVLVSSERDGQVKSEEKNPYTMTFTGGKWKVHRGDEVAVEGTLRLVDVTAAPKKFDLIKPPRLAPNTTVDYGIYEWKDDTLRYCTRNGPLGAGIGTPDLRPRDFTTRDGDGRTVYLWKRAQPPAKAPGEPSDWGVPRDGLRLGLYSTKEKGDGAARLMVVFDNVGTDDLVINLGIMLGNGKRQVPMAVRLVFTDSEGKKHIIRRNEPRIAGRVDPFVVPLPAGSRYSLITRDDLDGSIDRLPPGRYRVRAEFVGEAVGKKDVNVDTTGLALMPYWTGTIQSDECQVTLPAKPAK
jgi:RNA polymerase sigma factor (sigma-70 family)